MQPLHTLVFAAITKPRDQALPLPIGPVLAPTLNWILFATLVLCTAVFVVHGCKLAFVHIDGPGAYDRPLSFKRLFKPQLKRNDPVVTLLHAAARVLGPRGREIQVKFLGGESLARPGSGRR